MARKKERPVPRLCLCGGTPVVVKNKAGGWGCVCFKCDFAVYNHPSEADAVREWDEEVLKRDSARKRH